jgi:hypothetical protein
MQLMNPPIGVMAASMQPEFLTASMLFLLKEIVGSKKSRTSEDIVCDIGVCVITIRISIDFFFQFFL